MTDEKTESRNRTERMEKEALWQLLHFHERTGKQKAKELVKRAAGRFVPPEDLIFWPTGLLANALAENLDRWQNREEVTAALCTCFDRWIKKGMPVRYVDDVLCGVALIILHQRTGEEKYKAGADKMAAYLFGLAEREADGAGSIPYRPAQKNKDVYADGIGMMCPFLCRYGMAYGEERAVRLAFTQIENMLQYGMDEKTGLPYHGFRYENRVKYGIIGWGRATGWLLMGMAGVLESLGDRYTEYAGGSELARAFSALADSTAAYQREDGAYCWQLQAQEGPADSSAAAMIACALRQRPGSEKTAEYIGGCEKDGKIYQCSGECMGFSQYPQIYGAYPWSLGPALGLFAKCGTDRT